MKYYIVEIYYGGDAPVWEIFDDRREAEEFYRSHDRCNPPEERFPRNESQEEDWDMRIAARERAAE